MATGPATSSGSTAGGDVIKATTGLDIVECKGEFEITNFPAVCAVSRTMSNRRDDCREVCSDSIMVAGKFKFGIAVVWTVNSRGAIEKDSKFGVYVQRLDDFDEECALLLKQMQVMNRHTAKSCVLCDPLYQLLQRGQGQGWSPSFKKRIGIDTLRLNDILNEAKGWLHAGALRIQCQMAVATGSVSQPAPQRCLDICVPAQQEVCDALQGLLTSGDLSDVTVIVGDDRIQVHSQILSARSPVFATMLSSCMRGAHERNVHISDLEASAVKAVITFLYTGAVDPEMLESDESALSLLQAAHRYDIVTLADKCTRALGTRLYVDTVFERLRVADLIGCTNLRTQCLDFIREHISEVQATEAYANFAMKNPNLLMDIIAVISPPAAKKSRQASMGGHCSLSLPA